MRFKIVAPLTFSVNEGGLNQLMILVQIKNYNNCAFQDRCTTNFLTFTALQRYRYRSMEFGYNTNNNSSHITMVRPTHRNKIMGRYMLITVPCTFLHTPLSRN